MRHYTEDEWVEFHYDESDVQLAMRQHAAECPACKAILLELEADLAEMKLEDLTPSASEEYGPRVWESVQARLPQRPESRVQEAGGAFFAPIRLRTSWWLAFTGAAAALILASFYSGRIWEYHLFHSAVAENPARSDAQAKQRVILFVVSDHLDRSQKLLAELDDPDAAAKDKQLQATARELLTENRLYRANALAPAENRRDASSAPKARGGAAPDQDADASLQEILDDLEPVLVEIAHQPDSLKPAQILQLRKELNTGSLLFEIRVLRTQVRGDDNGGGSRNQKSLTQIRKGLI